MKLEEEIKQKKFKNEFQKLAVNLIYTNNWLINSQAKTFSKFGITGTQYNILRILRGQLPEPASVNLLKDRMLDKRSDASRLVERLRLKGYIERKVCPNDRRKAEVIISKKGLELLVRIDSKQDELNEMFCTLNKSEAKTINDLLDKLRGNGED